MEATGGRQNSGASTAQKLDGGHPTDADMIEQALSCVAWDESVDLARLLVLEHAYNRTILTNTVAEAAGHFPHQHRVTDQKLTVNSLATKGDVYSTHMVCYRLRGSWSVICGDVDVVMTDTELADCLAICARHVGFDLSYYWMLPEDEGSVVNRAPRRYRVEEANFAHTWVARLVAALARQRGAWTGIDIMRIRNLCAALLKVLDTRMHTGPLASVDVPKCAVPLDQSKVLNHISGLASPQPREVLHACRGTGEISARSCVVAESDGAARADDVLESMRRGLAHTALLRSRGIDFKSPNDGTCFVDTQCFLRTRDVLDVLHCSTERLYATEPYFCKMIAPAEYKAMAEDAPFGSTFYR